jgi:hypothetical protein
MKKINRLVLFLLFLFQISSSYGAVVTLVDNFQVSNGDEHTTVRAGLSINTDREVGGVQFNNDGTKMFVRFYRDEGGETDYSFIDEYDLSIPFDASSGTYAGDDERCDLNHGLIGTIGHNPFDFYFSNDGMYFYFANRAVGGTLKNNVLRFDLTVPFDISTCSYSQRTEHLLTDANRNNSLAGDDGLVDSHKNNRLMGVSLSNDGKKMFIITYNGKVLEFNLSTPYDVTTFSVNNNAGIDVSSHVSNPMSIEFSEDGKRFFVANHSSHRVVQISLDAPFDTSSHTVDGFVNLNTTGFGNMDQMRHATFSKNGLMMYISNDDSSTTHLIDQIYEFSLACPFNIIAGKCPSITKGDRTGMAIAQIEVATRTIEHSTDTALNRLKWIRRNKDLQDLSYQNIKLNFSNQMLASLSEAIQISTKEKEKDNDIFYWAEGSLAFGKVRETDTSSKKKIYTDGITIGADKFTVGDGIKGLAFRFSQNDVKVGTAGSKLDANTYNLTYYSTAPVKDDRRFLDTIIGVGALKYNISSILDGSKLNGNRNGRQIYGTLKIKEEIKKDDHTLIPAAQIDLGYTLLSSYSESGISSMKFDKQSIQSRNLRLSLASVEELNNQKYKMKRHGKIEYQANLHRSSNIKYSYIGDSASGKFDTKLNSGALHNINGEVGIDVIYDDNFSLFFIYELNEALGKGYTQKIHLAIGYLPQKNTNFAFKIEGDDILKSKYIYTKNVNGLDIDFYLLNNNAMRPETFDEIALNLRKVF